MKGCILGGMIALLWSNWLFPQEIISGKVVDDTSKPIPNLNVLFYPAGSAIAASFAITDLNGLFSASVNSDADSLDIVVSSIHFRKVSVRIENKTQALFFEMIPDVKQLETFTVKASPIERRGDTVSYLVSSFSADNDRTIGDVLRRMPGIEVEQSGRILYQGVPIQKFYVDGLDLMDGRYVVISSNLPYASVSTVEVLENHQPIRILEDRVGSQQASLNLKLKSGITLTGTAFAGIGCLPLLWDINLSPMIFNKKFQAITSYQTNNTGRDVASQMRTFSLQELKNNLEKPNQHSALLGIQSTQVPAIAESRYLDNNVHLINLNGITLLNNGIQLRGNFYFINDIQQEQACLKNTLYTPTDTLVFNEKIKNKAFQNYFYGAITLNRNVKKNYLLNKLDFSINSNFNKGALLQQTKEVDQRLDHPLGFLSNDLRSIHTLGKKLIEFSSFISVENNPNYLMIKPGVFEDILNNGAVYEKARQSLIKKTLFTEHGTAMVFGHKNLGITPGFGVVYEQQTLGSKIETYQPGQARPLDERFTNDQFQYNIRVYAKTELELLRSGFKLNIKMPFSWIYNRLIDHAQDTNLTIKKCVFEPAISLNYKLKGFWKIGGSWVLTNRPDNTGFHHFGYVLLNYRSLSQNPTPFAFNKRQKFMATLSYRNTLSSFFNVFNYWYSISDYQLIYKYQVSSDGSTVLKALSIPNRATSFGFYLQSSKYLSGTRSTLGFKISFSQQQGFSYLNEALFNTRNQIILIEPYLSTRLVNGLHIEYQLTANYLKTFVVSEKLGDIAQFRHQISLFTLFEKKHLFNISTEFYRINGASLIFSDFKYRFSITRPKIDIETVWNNILNTAEFVTYQSDYTTVLETTYLLRPSQVSLTVRFNF